MEYDPTQFDGAAPFYLRGRPPYSAELGTVLAAELGLDGRGRLVDVGSGPGTVGVTLARWFEHVTFVEPDAGMMSAARQHASSSGLTSVEFLATTAEALAGLDLAPARVVTFGQSFHRVERTRVAEVVFDLLEPGGSMVLVVHDPTRPAPPQPADTALIPHENIRQLIRRFLGSELRSGARPASSYGEERFEQSVARSRFGPPRTAFAPGRGLVRDVDSVVANHLSMSIAAPALFGARLTEFVAALRVLLTGHAPHGRFWDWPGDTALIIGTKPGRSQPG